MNTLFAFTFALLTLGNSPAQPSSVSTPDEPARSRKVFAAAVFPAVDQSKIWLYLEKFEPNAKVTVELLDTDGALMVRETIPTRGRKNTYRQQFDLSQLTDGQYTLRLSSNNQTETRIVNLSTSTPTPQQPLRLISMH